MTIAPPAGRPSERSLDSIAWLAPLSPEARHRLAERCRWARYAPHETILDRNDRDTDAYMVVDGRVRVVNFSFGGREISFDEFGPGHVFGELAALDGQPRSATILALTPTTVAMMPARVFQDTVSGTPEIALTMMKHLAGVVRRGTERIMDLSTLAANNRVQAELLRLARGVVRPDGTAVLKPAPVHADIAARVSTTRETVARVFSDLVKNGIVKRQGQTVLISDVEALQDIVDEVRGDS